MGSSKKSKDKDRDRDREHKRKRRHRSRSRSRERKARDSKKHRGDSYEQEQHESRDDRRPHAAANYAEFEEQPPVKKEEPTEGGFGGRYFSQIFKTFSWCMTQ